MTLSQQQAQFRYSLIEQKSIKYTFVLSLYPFYYRGVSVAEFTLHNTHQKLLIDCSSKTIKKMIINDQQVQKTNIKHEATHLYIQYNKQKIGKNIVLVQYQNNYDTDERGLMSFIDVDGKQYLYSQFQSYFANRVFALFDQPDLKAVMDLYVICPGKWQKVLSNQHPTFNQLYDQQKHLQKIGQHHKPQIKQFIQNSIKTYQKQQINQIRVAAFPTTKLMPTYIFCIIAGQYEQIKLKQQHIYKNIPMSLYCSTSYLPHVQKMSPFLFQLTLQCMKFFQSFFGVPYQFSKYDQIFVHEMQSYAMENTGMVTYHDAQYIWVDQVTDQKALQLFDTMAHQLAHHWFGNLATMKWWDDLWLKQSFAQFIGFYALQVLQKKFKIVKYQSSMAQLLNRKYEEGYADDKAVTTHPIRGLVENTAVAQAIFDGITYVKGASTLKQLVFLMGQVNFSSALKNYFTKYSFANTTLEDFIGCLQQKFQNQQNLNLQQWKKIWLQQCSLNQIQPQWWGCQKNQNQQQKILKITQRPFTQKYPLLRPHKIKIALFKSNGSYDSFEVFIPAQKQINIPISPENSQQYEAVLLNYQDHAFVNVVLDRKSQQFFKNNVLKIKDVLTRTYIWRIFYSMVVDVKISSQQFLQFFNTNILRQESDVIVQRNYFSALQSLELYTPQHKRKEHYAKLFNLTLTGIQNQLSRKIQNMNNNNRLVILRNYLCKLASSKQSIETLHLWHLGKHLQKLTKLQISLNDRWIIISKILQYGTISRQQKIALLNKNAQQDKSQTSQLQTIKCMAIIASQQQFMKNYMQIQDPSSPLTINTKKYLIEGMKNNMNRYNMLHVKKIYFQDLNKCAKVLEPEHLKLLIINLQPIDDNLQETIHGFKSVNVSNQKLSKVKYKMDQLIDLLQKRAKAYQKFYKQ